MSSKRMTQQWTPWVWLLLAAVIISGAPRCAPPASGPYDPIRPALLMPFLLYQHPGEAARPSVDASYVHFSAACDAYASGHMDEAAARFLQAADGFTPDESMSSVNAKIVLENRAISLRNAAYAFDAAGHTSKVTETEALLRDAKQRLEATD